MRKATLSKFEARAEVSGAVRKIVAKVGDRVEAGNPVIYLECMKMEIPVIVDDGGTVREVMVAENDLVEQGQVVAILED